MLILPSFASRQGKKQRIAGSFTRKIQAQRDLHSFKKYVMMRGFIQQSPKLNECKTAVKMRE
jgi:hypothetical protein